MRVDEVSSGFYLPFGVSGDTNCRSVTVPVPKHFSKEFSIAPGPGGFNTPNFGATFFADSAIPWVLYACSKKCCLVLCFIAFCIAVSQSSDCLRMCV